MPVFDFIGEMQSYFVLFFNYWKETVSPTVSLAPENVYHEYQDPLHDRNILTANY